MAIAGKVAITLSTENGGSWSADVTYDRLVAVKHNNNLYISRKTVTNVEPPNDEFWFLALEGYSGEDVQALIDRLNELSDLIQAIITGTQQVGNSKTLDGHEAEYFAPLDNAVYKSYSITTNDADLEELLEQIHSEAISGSVYRVIIKFEYHSDKYGSNGGNRYLEGYKYGNGNYGYQIFKSYATKTQYLRIKENGVWNDKPSIFATTADLTSALANYLPLNNSSSIPRVTVDGATGLILKNCGTYNNAHTIQFEDANGVLGLFGFKNRELMVQKFTNGVSSNWFTLLHTGIKPTGTYTGNGDATTRTIATGGIGKAVLIQSQYATIFVHGNGGNGVSYTGEAKTFTTNEISYYNGIITCTSNDECLNMASITYTYEDL